MILIGFLTSMQIRLKLHEILARIQDYCSIDAHARSFSSRTNFNNLCKNNS